MLTAIKTTPLPGGNITTSDFAVSVAPMDLVFPCTIASNGYGQDNLNRFNEAYVVSFRTGETLHVPKENEDEISRKHNRGGTFCEINGFKNGAPKLAVQPGFIAVRDARDGE